MRIAFIILAVAEFLASALFIWASATDIQLGFAILFFFMGCNSVAVALGWKK